MKEGVTIDSLARMMAEGFSSMEKRFDGLENRVGGLEVRMETLESEVRATNQRMGVLEGEVRLTNQHIDRVIMPMLDSHAARIKSLEIRTS